MPKALAFLVFFLWPLFSCSQSPLPQFDGVRAYQFLSVQCDFGPRNPGSEGHRQALEYLESELQKSSGSVRRQNFKAPHPTVNGELELTNLMATFYPEAAERVLLCAHWDTRPWADRDLDSSRRKSPIMGANDGASGVAVLLHLAEMLAQKKPKYGVDIILFDGEDMGTEESPRSYGLGSQHFAGNLSGYRPAFAILLDMVGDKDLLIYKEEYSVRYAAETVDLIWERAKKLKLDCFSDSVGYRAWDDHIPLIERGIPCADIIDFGYPAWHTTNDTKEMCSAASLEKVGRLLVSILYQ